MDHTVLPVNYTIAAFLLPRNRLPDGAILIVVADI